MDNIGYLSLSKAAGKLKISETELIELASSGQITLSVLLPNGYTPWLMTVRNNISSIRYQDDHFFGKMHLFPHKIESVILLNLTKEDCSRFEYSNLIQGTFESAYINDHLANVFDSNFNYLELLSTDEDMICKIHTDEDITDNEICFSAEKMGITILNNPSHEYCRRFVLFKETYVVPKMGTSLAAVKALDINESDLVINSNDYNKLQVKERVEIHKDVEKALAPKLADSIIDIDKIILCNTESLSIDFGLWCSKPLHYLIYLSLQFTKDSFSIENYIEDNFSIVKNQLKYLRPNKRTIGKELVEYFLKLAEPNSSSFNSKMLSDIKDNLINNEMKIIDIIPIQITALIYIAQKIYLIPNNENTTNYNQEIKNELEALGFNGKVSLNAATIIKVIEKNQPKRIN